MSSALRANSDGGEVEAINTNIVTLTRFLTEEQAKIKEATGDFTYVHCSTVQIWREERTATELTSHDV